MINQELYSELSCALLHNIDVCNECGKCEGKDAIERRMILVEKVAKEFGMPYPWLDECGYNRLDEGL